MGGGVCMGECDLLVACGGVGGMVLGDWGEGKGKHIK